MKHPCLTVRRSTALSTPRKCAVRRTIQTGAPAVMHGQATHRHASTGTPLHNEKEPPRGCDDATEREHHQRDSRGTEKPGALDRS